MHERLLRIPWYYVMVWNILIAYGKCLVLIDGFCIFPGPSIFLIVSGSLDISCNSSQEELCEGAVLFMSASTELKLYPKLSKDMLIFQAYCSL